MNADVIFQIVLFLAGAAIGAITQVLPKPGQKWAAGILAACLIATSLIWLGYELGSNRANLTGQLPTTPTNTPSIELSTPTTTLPSNTSIPPTDTLVPSTPIPPTPIPPTPIPSTSIPPTPILRTQPTIIQPREIAGGSLRNCSGFANGETRTVSPGAYVTGDIVIAGIRQYDSNSPSREKEGTVAFFEQEATVYAQWGAGCYEGNISFLNQVIHREYTIGCETGCDTVRSVVVHSVGQQEVRCYYRDGATAELQDNRSETWCP